MVFSGTIDGSGLVSATLLTGDYTMRATHPNVVAPADPEQRARTYSTLVTDAQPAPALTAALAIRAAGRTRALLTLDDPASAACP